MLDSDRKRSAGFAFIEFAHHENSRTFIEELTKSYNYLSPRPYVIEFAIQDSRKMLKLQSRQK
jgi:RNA recognition motif-containing protein